MVNFEEKSFLLKAEDTLNMLFKSEFPHVNLYRPLRNKSLRKFFIEYFVKAMQCAEIEDQIGELQDQIVVLQKEYVEVSGWEDAEKRTKRSQEIFDVLNQLDSKITELRKKLLEPLKQQREHVYGLMYQIVKSFTEMGVE